MTRVPRDRNRRRTPRARAANLVGYSDRGSGRPFTVLGAGATVDLSASGLRLKTVEALPLGSELIFDLKIAGDLHRIEGRVVWGEELEADKEYEFGVHFTQLADAVREKIRLYVSVKGADESSGPHRR